MKGRKMGWQKDEERNELCFDISANECFCLKRVPNVVSGRLCRVGGVEILKIFSLAGIRNGNGHSTPLDSMTAYSSQSGFWLTRRVERPEGIKHLEF